MICDLKHIRGDDCVRIKLNISCDLVRGRGSFICSKVRQDKEENETRAKKSQTTVGTYFGFSVTLSAVVMVSCGALAEFKRAERGFFFSTTGV
jgi:hypothetical protein